MPSFWSKVKSFGTEPEPELVSGTDSGPERAKKLIAANRLTKVKFLSLGECGLTRIPDDVGELVWLESLSLSDGTPIGTASNGVSNRSQRTYRLTLT